MGARFYALALGRWISADTILPEPGNPQDLNRFAFVRNNPLIYIDPTGHACKIVDGDEVCGDDIPPWLSYDDFEMFIQWLKWQGYDLTTTTSNIWAALSSYPWPTENDPPIATWTWDDGQGAIPFLPNPHFQLRKDVEALNDLFLLGTDITADAMTILGHLAAIGGGASVFTPPLGDELLWETGAGFFLKGATILDVISLADTAATRGLNSKAFGQQGLFLLLDATSGRITGTYVAQLTVAATDTGVDILGDSAGISKRYGSGLTFYKWCAQYCPDQ
jgi:hypothetical protein